MANFRSISILSILLIVSLNLSCAIYEDQVGKFDWKRSYIGRVKQAHFDNKRIIVSTEENVIASLNPRSGQIQWRQVLEDPEQQQIQLLHIDRDTVTVSGAKNSFYIRGWDTPTGSILWEWTIYMERVADSLWAVDKDQLLHLVLVPGSHVEVTGYNIRNGENRGKTTKITTPWLSDVENCALTSPYFTCLINGQLYYINILSEETKLQSHPIQALTGEAATKASLLPFSSSKPAVMLIYDGHARLVEFENGAAKALPYPVQSSAVMIENSVFQLEINPENPDKLVRAKSMQLSTGQNENSVEIEYPLGLGAPYIVTGQCKNEICELLLSSTDNALTLVKLPEGKVSWTREEALSNVVAVEFFELPVSELDASIENEFKTSSGDVVSMLLHRLSTQTKQLYNIIFGGQLLANNGLVRDEFGLHKIIVVATAVGKLFAIDTLTGSIVWSYRLPNVRPFPCASCNSPSMLLLVQRTARYAPFPAQCVLLTQDSNTGNGVLFRFDPITGISINGIERLNYKIKQAMVLPHEDENHLKSVLVVTSDDQVKIYPEDGAVLARRNSDSIFLFTVERSLSILKGYQLKSAADGIKQLWEVNLGPSKLVAVSTRPPSERVHSQGRVLPDRSVYYKYVNPNLIAVATMIEDPVHKQVLSIYLIDGVTGLILYSTSHKRTKGPIHLVHSENWLVYTFFNDRFRRTEIVAAELYEGYIQSNSTVFSSFAISQLPHIETQSYILPANPLTMTVTLTERGITHKFLLMALSSGAVTEIPWFLLQPRFQDIPCGPEESCIPYMPEIPLPAEAVINYNQTLGRTRGIQVAPARLESTSHVLVYGLDLFYTRVAPSKTFDVLKEDFDHRLIVLVLTGLILASYVTKHLASKKALRQAWK